ncbi:MAG: hypothetical protein NT031_11930 [Planctomycetota bacterium]|nr:hypothetical protein [Planctomycetota bacterium]
MWSPSISRKGSSPVNGSARAAAAPKPGGAGWTIHSTRGRASRERYCSNIAAQSGETMTPAARTPAEAASRSIQWNTARARPSAPGRGSKPLGTPPPTDCIRVPRPARGMTALSIMPEQYRTGGGEVNAGNDRREVETRRPGGYCDVIERQVHLVTKRNAP